MKHTLYIIMVVCGVIQCPNFASCQEVSPTPGANELDVPSVVLQPETFQSKCEIIDQLTARLQADFTMSVELNCISRIYDSVGEHIQLISDDDLQQVARLEEWVSAIRLHHTRVSDNGIGHLRNLRRLQILIISRDRRGVDQDLWQFQGVEISDRALQTICCLERLQWLSLTGTSQITDAGLIRFAQSASKLTPHNGGVICQPLHHLELSELDIDGSCLEALSQLPIEKLELTRLRHFDIENLSHLKRMNRLQELDLSNNASEGYEQWKQIDFGALARELPGVKVIK